MYTANTMASAIEALGMSLPNSSAQEAVSRHKIQDCEDAGKAVVRLVKAGITPSQILTREAFENAITSVIALERLDQRGAALAGDGARRERAAGARRLHAHRQARAGARRSAARAANT